MIIFVIHGCSFAQGWIGTGNSVFPVTGFSLENVTLAAADEVLSNRYNSSSYKSIVKYDSWVNQTLL